MKKLPDSLHPIQNINQPMCYCRCRVNKADALHLRTVTPRQRMFRQQFLRDILQHQKQERVVGAAKHNSVRSGLNKRCKTLQDNILRKSLVPRSGHRLQFGLFSRLL